MKKKLLFLLPPVILAVITFIWLFYKDGRWYYYHQEWQCMPLFFMHLLMPLFYFASLIVSIVKGISRNKDKKPDAFYLVSSVIMTAVCVMALFVFIAFTSGM